MNLSLTNISKKFGKTTVLTGLNLEIETGKVVAILGSSGCGKSTLLNIIAGFERCNSGKVKVNDKVLSDQEEKVFTLPEHRNIGYLFQNFALFPHMNVYKNVVFGVKDKTANKKKIVQDVLKLVDLTGYENRFPHELSGGQQQRIALARALAPKPGVLLLDEPFSGLDADLRISTRGAVRKILHEANATAILITHDLEEAFAIADYVAVMNNGVIEHIDTPENIYQSPATKFVANFVGQAVLIDGTVVNEGIDTDLGLFPSNAYAAKLGEKGKLMLRPENISISLDSEAHPPSFTSCKTRGVCWSVVEERYFRGAENLYNLRLPSGQLIQSITATNLIIDAGSRVKVEADADAEKVIFFDA